MRDLLLAEWMKSRTRWLPYVLLIVMVLGTGVQVWLFGYTAWWDIHDDPDPEIRADVPIASRTFTLPWALPALLDAGQFWGSLIMGIFIASAVATEYNWGTARQAIARGQSRVRWLTVKLTGLALFCAVLLLITLAWGVASMLFTSSLAGFEITLDPPGGAELSALEIPVIILRAGFGILPYALLAFAITVIGRSTALGAAGIILFMIIESTLIPVFGALPDPWPAFRSVTIGHNAASLLAANRIGSGDYLSLAPRPLPDASELPDPWVGFFVLCVWCVALLGLTYYVFRRRDLRLGTGE
jgi:ABC-type transport system involved in multi-copper enzyme maturation permease subunit